MDNMNENTKKEKVKYKVLFVPEDDPEVTRHFSIKLDVLIIFCVAVVFLVVASLSYCIILTGELGSVNEDVNTLSEMVNTLNEENSTLQSEKVVLQEKISILSDTVNEKVQQEEEAAQTYIPTGFPLKGTASYNEQETELDENPIAIFHASKGTSVIAAGNGKVASVEADEQYGYVITIDHGNGYMSMYRNGSKPKVSEGDEVTRATELFNIEEGFEDLGYQITEYDKYIDPLDIMEIYG